MRGLVLALLAAAALACSGGDGDAADAGPPDAATPAFPADYATSYTEVRDCRKSSEHDLNFIKVFADAAAVGPYLDRETPFPDGAVLVKEEHDFADTECSDPIIGWTVMIKDAGLAEELGWSWQRVDTDRTVVEIETPTCYGCHGQCTDVGYDGTCTEP